MAAIPPTASGPRCPHCGYLVGPGLPGERCPECGEFVLADPALLRWRRLQAVSKRWAPLITVVFIVVAAGSFALSAWARMPWELAAFIAAYTTGYLAIGVWCRWGYIAIPLLLSVGCGSPWVLAGSPGVGMWALAFSFIIAIPAMVGFVLGRALQLVLWWLDGVHHLHRAE